MRRTPQAYEALTVSYDQLTRTWDSVCNRTWTAGDKPSRVACRRSAVNAQSGSMTTAAGIVTGTTTFW